MPLAALAVAIVQGLLLWSLVAAGEAGRWPATDPRVMLPLALLALALPLTLQLLWPFARQRLLQVALAGAALTVIACGAAFAAKHLAGPPAADDGDIVAGFVLPLGIAWLLALPLLKLRLSTGRWTGPFPALFDITWRGALTLAEAALFTGVFWALLGLAAALFGLLGIAAVGDVITDPRFAIPATAVVGSAAIQLIGASAGMVDGLLRQLLSLLKWLLPLAGLIAVAFTLAMIPRLPALFAEGRKVMDATWLLWLVALTVLLLNAAYQTGQQPPGYGRHLERALRFVPPLLVVVAATALYSLALRTGAYGLTPARYWGIVTALAALAYAAGYSLAAWSDGPWFGKLGRVNIVVALALLAVLLTSLTPLADPLRLSIASQTRRALGAPDGSLRDGALRFLGREAGAAGRERLEALARQPDAAGGSAALRAAAARARLPVDPKDGRFEDWLARIDWRAAGGTPDQRLTAALRGIFVADDPRSARLDRAAMLRVDADGDGRLDALLLQTDGGAPNPFWLFTQDDAGGWTLRATGDAIGRAPEAEMEAALRDGDFTAVTPLLQGLRIGKSRLTLLPDGPR